MEFIIWKVEHGKGSSRPWFNYSLRGRGEVQILHETKFVALFPNIDVKKIPEAPETATIEIEARLK